jgi:hypothetical protein
MRTARSCASSYEAQVVVSACQNFSTRSRLLGVTELAFLGSQVARSPATRSRSDGFMLAWTPEGADSIYPTNCTCDHNYLLFCDTPPICFSPYKPSSGRQLQRNISIINAVQVVHI